MLKLIILKGNNVKKAMKAVNKIKAAKQPEGIFELCCELLHDGTACSYDNSRIYYLAYLLAKDYIEVDIFPIQG